MGLDVSIIENIRATGLTDICRNFGLVDSHVDKNKDGRSQGESDDSSSEQLFAFGVEVKEEDPCNEQLEVYLQVPPPLHALCFPPVDEVGDEKDIPLHRLAHLHIYLHHGPEDARTRLHGEGVEEHHRNDIGWPYS